MTVNWEIYAANGNVRWLWSVFRYVRYDRLNLLNVCNLIMHLFYRKKQKGSELLSKDVNNRIFDLVGPNCQILSMTMIELHRSPDKTGEGDWTKQEVGVLCLVRDLNKKCYFFRIFCLIRKRMIWEYGINVEIEYFTPKPFRHIFQAENCMYAFYFASEQEASLLAVRMNEISTEMSKKERSSEEFIHKMNPIVKPASRFDHMNFSKNKIARCSSTDSSRKLSPNVFKLCLGRNETKKKNVTSEEIADPKHFEHDLLICEFKEKWNQIQCGNRKNESLFREPFSSSTINISPTLSYSILPVVNGSLNRPKPAGTSTFPLLIEKAARSSGRFSTFIHPGENTMRTDNDRDITSVFPKEQLPLPPCLSVSCSLSENVRHFDNIKRPTLSLREIKLAISNRKLLDSKSVCDEVSRHDLGASYVPPLPPKTSPRLTHRSVSSVTVFPNPCFLPKIAAEKRNIVVNDRDLDPAGCHYDIVLVGEPRPVNPPVSKSISRAMLELKPKYE